jgi:predicted CoA-substrate-specific enzyme activase
MRVAGLDVGSRTVKVAVVDGGDITHTRVAPNSHDPMSVCRTLLDGVDAQRVVATGYGRHLYSRHAECEVITEIRAVAIGAARIHPTCRTILDIGGQDTKAIALDPNGRMTKFEMNDKCAAGTGRFLEVMATALGFTMDEFVAAAASASSSRKLNSMCTVFAESEVISEVARGTSREELALGIHRSIADRASAMLRRIPLADDVLFCGGGAKNDALHRLVETSVGRPVHRGDDPQVVAAIGCALHGTVTA